MYSNRLTPHITHICTESVGTTSIRDIGDVRTEVVPKVADVDRPLNVRLAAAQPHKANVEDLVRQDDRHVVLSHAEGSHRVVLESGDLIGNLPYIRRTKLMFVHDHVDHESHIVFPDWLSLDLRLSFA